MTEQTKPTTAELWRFNRHIVFEVGNTIDECGQFQVRVVIDDKERYSAWFTDKSGE